MSEREGGPRALVVLDESTATARSLARVVTALGSTASITLLSVVAPSYAYPTGMDRPLGEEARQMARRMRASSQVSDASAALAAMGVRGAAIERRGEFETVVLRAIRDVDPDLVVIGSNSRGLLDALFPSGTSVTPLRSGWDVLVLNGARREHAQTR